MGDNAPMDSNNTYEYDTSSSNRASADSADEMIQRLEAFNELDPAESPPAAEELARDLAERLDAVGRVAAPQQLEVALPTDQPGGDQSVGSQPTDGS